MAHTRHLQYRLATDTTFRGIVEEAAASPAQIQRRGLAMTFILPEAGNRGDYLTRFAWQAALDGRIQQEAMGEGDVLAPAGVTDAAIDTVVIAIWDRMAGVTEEGEGA